MCVSVAVVWRLSVSTFDFKTVLLPILHDDHYDDDDDYMSSCCGVKGADLMIGNEQSNAVWRPWQLRPFLTAN